MADEACIDTGRLTGGDWAEIQGMGGVRWLSAEAEHGPIHAHSAVGEVVRESPTDRNPNGHLAVWLPPHCRQGLERGVGM